MAKRIGEINHFWFFKNGGFFCLHFVFTRFFFFFSSDAQKSKARMNATAQQGQKANVPERAPTAILGVTCEAKKEEYFYYIIS